MNVLYNTQLYAYYFRMRRKQGDIIPIERDILIAAMDLGVNGTATFYGFKIAKEISNDKGARLLTGHGTLYRALARLEKQGYLESQWEDPAIAAEESRPRRKLYTLTAIGAATARTTIANIPCKNPPPRSAWATTT